MTTQSPSYAEKVTTKSISWSYASSPNAMQFKFPDGCYTVSLVEYVPYSFVRDERAIAAFKTFKEAYDYAQGMPERFDHATFKSDAGYRPIH